MITWKNVSGINFLYCLKHFQIQWNRSSVCNCFFCLFFILSDISNHEVASCSDCSGSPCGSQRPVVQVPWASHTRSASWPSGIDCRKFYLFLRLTGRWFFQDLAICCEHTGIWGRPTGRTRTNTFMPEETMTLPVGDLGGDGPRRWSGECLDLCNLSRHPVVFLLMHMVLLQRCQGIGADKRIRPWCQRLCCWSGCKSLGSEWRGSQCLQTAGTS